MQEKSNHINSVEKAFILLNFFLDNNEKLSLKELTAKSGWPKSTVYNTLSAMRRQGVIVQNEEDGKYSMGIHVLQLGNAVTRSLDIVNMAKPVMKKISDLVDRSVHLTVLHCFDVVLIAHAEPTKNPLKMVIAVGTSMPLYCNAHGKLFLASMPDSAVEKYLREAKLVPHTSKTITDRVTMFEQITKIRKQGYSVEIGERNVGISGVAAPILNSHGKVIYSFGVVGIFNDINPDDFEYATTLVKKGAHDISRQLGYKGR